MDLISSIQTDHPEDDDGCRRTGRKAAGSELSRQHSNKQGRITSEQPAVMENARSKKTKEHSTILHYQDEITVQAFLDSRRGSLSLWPMHCFSPYCIHT